MTAGISLRAATRDDARALAELIDFAGEGFGRYLWSQAAAPGQDPLEVGMLRAQREEGGFSYRHATIAEIDGNPAGLLLGYRLASPYLTGNLAALPETVRPLVELEAEVPGSWYVNALAAYPEFRGRGVGTRLLAEAERFASSANASTLSLIVAEQNERAKGLYLRTGYREAARRMLVPFPGLGHRGDWLLLTKKIAAIGPG